MPYRINPQNSRSLHNRQRNPSDQRPSAADQQTEQATTDTGMRARSNHPNSDRTPTPTSRISLSRAEVRSLIERLQRIVNHSTNTPLRSPSTRLIMDHASTPESSSPLPHAPFDLQLSSVIDQNSDESVANAPIPRLIRQPMSRREAIASLIRWAYYGVQRNQAELERLTVIVEEFEQELALRTEASTTAITRYQPNTGANANPYGTDSGAATLLWTGEVVYATPTNNDTTSPLTAYHPLHDEESANIPYQVNTTHSSESHPQIPRWATTGSDTSHQWAGWEYPTHHSNPHRSLAQIRSEQTNDEIMNSASSSLPTNYRYPRTLTLRHGQEFLQLTQWSLTNLGRSLRVEYEGEYSDDWGGTTRDALCASYDQLLSLQIIKLDSSRGTYQLNTLDGISHKPIEAGSEQANPSDTEHHTNRLLHHFVGLGHLFGLTLQHNQRPPLTARLLSDSHRFMIDLALDNILFEEIFSLQSLMERLNEELIMMPFTYLSEDPELEFAKFSLGIFNKEEAKTTLEFLMETPLNLSKFDALLKQLHFSPFSMSKDTLTDSALDVPGWDTPEWVQDLWGDRSTPSFASELEHRLSCKKLIDAACKRIFKTYFFELGSAQEFLEFIGNVTTPKLAAAEGLFTFLSQTPGLPALTSAEELKNQLVDTNTLQKKLKKHLSDNKSEASFFQSYFTLEDLPHNGPHNHQIKEHLPKFILSLIQNASPEELRNFLCYASGSPVLPEGDKISITVNGEYIEDLTREKIRKLPLPTAHSCAKQLDLDINTTIPRMGIDAQYFRESLKLAIEIHNKHGDGLEYNETI